MSESMTDEEIAKLVQVGQVDGFGELITRYENKLKRYAERFLNRPDEVTDMVQDVFIKAYTNIQSFDTSRRFSPWIYQIAHNVFVNELRRKDRLALAFDSDTLFSFMTSAETADGLAMSLEQKSKLEAVLDTLPLKYREIIQLYYYEEFSYQEISDILKIPINLVGVRLKRAKDKLETSYQTKYQKDYE